MQPTRPTRITRQQTKDTQRSHKATQSEMFGSNVADKYASAVTKILGLGWFFFCWQFLYH